jgi:hypothetical protein
MSQQSNGHNMLADEPADHTNKRPLETDLVEQTDEGSVDEGEVCRTHETLSLSHTVSIDLEV